MEFSKHFCLVFSRIFFVQEFSDCFIAQTFPRELFFAEEDRIFADDINAVSGLIKDFSFVEKVNELEPLRFKEPVENYTSNAQEETEEDLTGGDENGDENENGNGGPEHESSTVEVSETEKPKTSKPKKKTETSPDQDILPPVGEEISDNRKSIDEITGQMTLF